MTPEYLEELADAADPDELWRSAGLTSRTEWPADKLRQLDTGVALRRHAQYVRRLRNLLGTGRSLLVTPLTPNGTAVMDVPAPPKHQKLLERHHPITKATP